MHTDRRFSQFCKKPDVMRPIDTISHGNLAASKCVPTFNGLAEKAQADLRQPSISGRGRIFS
jgi:hypothetical protein